MSITKEEFNTSFTTWPQLAEVQNHCKEIEYPLVHLKGFRGSASQFFVAALAKQVHGIHVVVLNDKENAAYALNDLQDQLSKDKVLFFPSPFKYPYKQESVDNTNGYDCQKTVMVGGGDLWRSPKRKSSHEKGA